MTVLGTCKFEDDSIKSQGAILRTAFSALQVYGKFFSSLNGDLLRSELSNLAQNRIHPRFYGCPRYLQV